MNRDGVFGMRVEGKMKAAKMKAAEA